MKNLLIAFASLLILQSCSKDISYRYVKSGKITSLRIDDDSEYHFSTDNIVKNDIKNSQIIIVRKDTIPTLFKKQWKCNSGVCNSATNEWDYTSELDNGYYKIVLPLDYKIQTFDD